MTLPRVLPVKQTEAQFTAALVDLFHQYRWRVIHVSPSQVREGRWLTHGAGDIAGWPDLLACRGRRALAVECKVGRNKPTQAQLDWLAALGHVPGIEAHVWSPADWDQIVEAVR